MRELNDYYQESKSHHACGHYHTLSSTNHQSSTVTSASSSGIEFAQLNTTPSYAPDLVIEPIHIEAHLNFLLERKRIEAKIYQTFKNPNLNASTAGNTRSIRLNAVSLIDLKVHSIDKSSGSAKEVKIMDDLTFIYDGKGIDLLWETPFGPGEERIVAFEYVVENPVAGFYFSVPDEIYPNRVLHAVTDHEPERCRYWLPVVDFPTVRTTLDFYLTCPATMVAIANGAFVKETLSAHSTDSQQQPLKTVHYSLKVAPCPAYLYCVAVGNYIEVQDETVDGMPIRYYAPSGTPPDWLKRSFDKTPSMVKWISKKLDFPFPWPKYYQVCSPCIRGAMENISLVSWNDVYLIDETNALERKPIVDSVNLHEMAHTYFGDLVVIRHFEHTWLKEAWATYMESVWMEENLSQDDFIFEMIENARAYIAETSRYVRPMVTRIYDSSWTMFDGHTYPGGAWRIHMLRKLLGDNLFWTAVQKYLKKYAKRVVETEDFKKCLESESGLNLTRFFDQWYYGKGFPKLKGSAKFNAKSSCYHVSIEQVQQWGTIFQFALEVEVIDSDRNIYHSELIFDGQKSASTMIQFKSSKVKPFSIRLDYNQKILFSLEFNPGEDVLVNTAEHALDIGNRLWAFEELGRIGSVSSLYHVEKLIQKEPFYGVRAKVGIALGKLNSKQAHKVHAMMIEKETHPMALFPIVKAATKKDPMLRMALLSVIKRSKVGYRTLAFAFENLGQYQNEDDLNMMILKAQDPNLVGQHGIVRSGILKGIGQFHCMKAYEYIRSRIPAGVEPEKCRYAAMEAFSDCAIWQEKRFRNEAKSILAEFVSDPSSPFLRRAAVWALCNFEEEAADYLSMMRATKSLYPEQDWVYINRRIKRCQDSISASKQDKFKELQKTIEELEAKVKAIEDKQAELAIEKLELSNKSQKESDGVKEDSKIKEVAEKEISAEETFAS